MWGSVYLSLSTHILYVSMNKINFWPPMQYLSFNEINDLTKTVELNLVYVFVHMYFL